MGEAPNLVAAELARQHQIPIFYDPGPEIELFSDEWGDAMVSGATVLLLTYEESQMITGLQLAPEEMAEHLRQLGPELVILKLGGDGMIAHTADNTVRHAGFKVEVVDLTAAGDSVSAAVMYSYLEGHSLEKMVTIANATGAACVRKFGAGTNVPYKHEVQAVLSEFGAAIDF